MNKLNYINKLLIEGRVDDLRVKYVDTKKVTEGAFKIMSNNDPSGNQKYLEWMLKELSKKSSWVVSITPQYLVRQVTKFHDNLHKIEKKDLYQYNSWKELEDTVKKAEETLTKGERKRIEKDGSHKIFEDDTYLVVVPMSREASCHYGQGTRWCTSARNNNAFDEYYEGGTLFYIINKSITEPKKGDYTDMGEYADELEIYRKYSKVAMFVLFDSYERGMTKFDDYQLFDGNDNLIDDNVWSDFIYDEGIKQGVDTSMVKYFVGDWNERAPVKWEDDEVPLPGENDTWGDNN